MYHKRTRHIDVKHLFIREIVDKGEITIKKISTAHYPIDMLTKFLYPNSNIAWP